MLTQMCSNRAIVDSLECCMEDLIECFEDFVKKSLILIFLGIGIIVGLLCYLLKMVSDRPSLNSAFVPQSQTHTKNEVLINKKNKNVEEVNEMSNTLKKSEDMKTDKIDNNIVTLDADLDKEKTTTAINTLNAPMLPSFDEKVLRTVGLSSCSKHGCCGGSSTHIYIPSRVPVPSLSNSPSKSNMPPGLRKRSSKKSLPSLLVCPKTTKPGSCCSMCCHEEPKRDQDSEKQILYRNQQ